MGVHCCGRKHDLMRKKCVSFFHLNYLFFLSMFNAAGRSWAYDNRIIDVTHRSDYRRLLFFSALITRTVERCACKSMIEMHSCWIPKWWKNLNLKRYLLAYFTTFIQSYPTGCKTIFFFASQNSATTFFFDIVKDACSLWQLVIFCSIFIYSLRTVALAQVGKKNR
jgi:hypothetical protein